MLRNPEIPRLLRATGKLSETDLQVVIEVVQSLARQAASERGSEHETGQWSIPAWTFVTRGS